MKKTRLTYSPFVIWQLWLWNRNSASINIALCNKKEENCQIKKETNTKVRTYLATPHSVRTLPPVITYDDLMDDKSWIYLERIKKKILVAKSLQNLAWLKCVRTLNMYFNYHEILNDEKKFFHLVASTMFISQSPHFVSLYMCMR